MTMFDVPTSVAHNAEEAVDLLISEIRSTDYEDVRIALDTVADQLRSGNWEEADTVWRQVFSRVLTNGCPPRLEAVVFLTHHAMLNVHSSWRFGASKELIVLSEAAIASKVRLIEEEESEREQMYSERSAVIALRRRIILFVVYLVVISCGIAFLVLQREAGWRIVGVVLCLLGGVKLIRAFVVDEAGVERELDDLLG